MTTVDINHVSKSFGPLKAVDDVSFEVNAGEIFGLLGPNGAGKTTTIRILLDIFKPDSGSISILGGPMSEDKKNHIGYLPEERGLYQDIPLERCLIYLATLKGLSPIEARKRIQPYLERFDLAPHRNKKVKELSKGMQQKAQLIITLVHKPDLVIIDEPFSALDPVNTQMVKDLLLEERNRGVTVVMCTHQMHQVEQLCDRLVLIDHGKAMLYGQLTEIQQQYSANAVWVRSRQPLPQLLPGVVSIEPHNGSQRLNLADHADPQMVLRALIDNNVEVDQFEIALPTLDEIFIKVVAGKEVGDE